MRTVWVGLMAVSLLAACSSSPIEQPAASVEDRKPSAIAKPGDGAQPAPKPVAQKPIAGVDLTPPKPAAGISSVLKDPNNILARRSIYFEYDSADVKEEFRALVEAHARYLRDHAEAKMLIQGNTDERGSREYNLALGQKRADALKKMLLLLGAREAQVESVSLGEEKPKSQGSSEEAYAQNRRGDILYGGEY